jgi:gliding motility-associated-like protein
VIVSESGAIAFSNAPVCEGENVELYTVNGATSYQWIGPNGFSSTQQNPVITNALTTQSGTYTVAVSGGNCSGTATVNVQVNPSGSPVASIQSFPGAAVCSNNNTVILVANQGSGYIWSNGATTQAIQVNPGSTNTYTVTVSDAGGCGGTATASITIEVGSPISASISSSGDVICPGESVNLTATVNPSLGAATYVWNNGQTSNSILVNLGGTYQVVVSQQGCTDTASIYITMFDPVSGTPLANNDVDSTQINVPVSIGITNNDSAIGTITIVTGGNHGSAVLDGNKLVYTPNLNYTGWDTLRYVVCSTVCSNVCDTAEVYVYVIPKTVVLIPGILTPNQDGYNDGWVIGGIEAYPDHRVTILNRWGDVVFEASPYNNDWVGQCNTGLKLGGDKLPRGTYYYVVYLGEGEEIIKGFVELTY